MLAAAANIIVIVVVVAAVTIAIVINPVAVIVLAFVLCGPPVLLLCQLVFACCFASVAGIFATCSSFGWLLCSLPIAVVVRQISGMAEDDNAYHQNGFVEDNATLPVAVRLKKMLPIAMAARLKTTLSIAVVARETTNPGNVVTAQYTTTPRFAK
jgi:hypothetical protein